MNTTEKMPLMEDKPKPSVGRKRGRPRTVTDDQEVPEVGQIASSMVLELTNSRDVANNYA
jgi:hypothetical protein